MDYFSIYGSSFGDYIYKLDRVLQRCDDTNMILSWDNIHFMVREDIVLGHIVSQLSIEVDKVKVETIAKLELPSRVKENRFFQGMQDYTRDS